MNNRQMNGSPGTNIIRLVRDVLLLANIVRMAGI